MSDDTDRLLAEYTGRLARYTWWLMVAALLSLGCTLWIALSTKELRDFAEQQSEDIKEQIMLTHDALVTANRQANAQETANAQYRESIKRQLRAELTFLSLERSSAPNEDMVSIAHLKNVGLTAAYSVSTYSDEGMIKISANGRPPYDFNDGPDRNKDRITRTVGAGIEIGELIDRAGKKYSKADLDAFSRGEKAYMVWGVAYYKDYDLADHFMRYCVYFERGKMFAFVLCSSHNESN